MTDGERVAARFHEVYELLAPDHGYKTRAASAVLWQDVPEPNRSLMIHTCEFLLRERCIEVGAGLPGSWEPENEIETSRERVAREARERNSAAAHEASEGKYGQPLTETTDPRA